MRQWNFMPVASSRKERPLIELFLSAYQDNARGRIASRYAGRGYPRASGEKEEGEVSTPQDPQLPPPDPDPKWNPPGPSPAREPEEPGPDVFDPGSEPLSA
jgi:hypothetical protein